MSWRSVLLGFRPQNLLLISRRLFPFPKASPSPVPLLLHVALIRQTFKVFRGRIHTTHLEKMWRLQTSCEQLASHNAPNSFQGDNESSLANDPHHQDSTTLWASHQTDELLTLSGLESVSGDVWKWFCNASLVCSSSLRRHEEFEGSLVHCCMLQQSPFCGMIRQRTDDYDGDDDGRKRTGFLILTKHSSIF